MSEHDSDIQYQISPVSVGLQWSGGDVAPSDDDGDDIQICLSSDDSEAPAAKRRPASKLSAPLAKAHTKREKAAVSKAAKPKMEFTAHT